ncbi:MAG: hypothetical protein NVV57_11035 [Demequina sp.]|nr:hypothetical protein [Demequina sp.]
MKTFRIIGAAFMVLLGSMVLVLWSVAGKAVSAIESGEAANNITQKLLDDPNFSSIAAEAVVANLEKQTEGRFINRIIVAFGPELEQIVKNVLESDRVNEAVTNSVDKVSTQLTQELTEPNRPSGPFTLTIDVSDRVNQRIDEIPVVGTFIPDVTIQPIQKELIDAQTFDQIRGYYAGVKLVASWGFLVGLALIVGGFFVAPRSRWYWPQAALAVGFIVLAVSIAIRRVVPAQIVKSLPGNTTGGPAFVKDFLSSNATGPIASRLLAMAVWAIVLAVLFWAIARLLPGFRDKYLVATPAGAVVSAPDAVVADAVVVAPAVVTETVVVESEPSSPATEPEPAPVAKAPARKTPTKTTPAKATPAKATPAKKATPASAAPKPKPTRTRKPPAASGDTPSE